MSGSATTARKGFVPEAHSPFGLLEDVARENEWPSERLEDDLIIFVESEGGVNFEVLCRWDDEERILSVDMSFGASFPEDRLEEMLHLVNALNRKTTFGSLAVSEGPDPQVYFRYDAFFTRASQEPLLRMLSMAFVMCSDAIPSLRFVAEGMGNVEALKEGLFDLPVMGEA